MPRRYLHISALALILAAAVAAISCSGRQSTDDEAESTPPEIPDTLRVGTLYSPTSYFLYRDEEMGYDYTLAKEFAESHNAVLDLKVATSLEALIAMLDSGKVDLAAYEIPITSEYRGKVIPCGPVATTTQVLVQPKSASERITDITQLVGRDVYVEKNSKYQQRLQNINDNLGGGINIHPVDADTLITEDLLEMVSKGTIPMTIVDSDIARINKTYYPDLDITLEVSFPQRASWGVAPSKAWLADSVDAWLELAEPKKENAMLLKRYFELSKRMPPSIGSIDYRSGRMSPFDNIFKTKAEGSPIDWRLLAAQGYVESRYDSTAVSWAGARGVMQVMPRTARQFGVKASALSNPATSISLAVKIMETLDKMFANKVPDERERMKFALAAYNSGPAHVLDAIALAKRHGKDPTIWSGNVETALLMKSKPEYFNDPVCKYGYFRGTETVRYVKDVTTLYNKALESVKK